VGSYGTASGRLRHETQRVGRNDVIERMNMIDVAIIMGSVLGLFLFFAAWDALSDSPPPKDSEHAGCGME